MSKYINRRQLVHRMLNAAIDILYNAYDIEDRKELNNEIFKILAPLIKLTYQKYECKTII